MPYDVVGFKLPSLSRKLLRTSKCCGLGLLLSGAVNLATEVALRYERARGAKKYSFILDISTVEWLLKARVVGVELWRTLKA